MLGHVLPEALGSNTPLDVRGNEPSCNLFVTGLSSPQPVFGQLGDRRTLSNNKCTGLVTLKPY